MTLWTRAVTMPCKKNSSSTVYHCGVLDVISCQSCTGASCKKPPTSHIQESGAGTAENCCSCCCLLVSEAQAAGPVIDLATDNGLVYSVSQGGPLEAWAELGLQALASPLPSTTMSRASATSAMAVLGGSGSSKCMATAHKDFKIRLWQYSAAAGGLATSRGLDQAGTLPSLRQYLHNWTLQHRYVQTRRHGKKNAWMQHSDTISAIAFSVDRTLLYSASWDRTVKVWSIAQLRCEETFTAHIDSINTMVVGSADGLLYTGSADKSIKVWSRWGPAVPGAKGGKRKCKHSLVAALEEQGAAVNALVISRDGSLMYSGGSDGRIVVWKSRSSPSWPHKAADAAQLLQVEETLEGHAGRAVLCLELLQRWTSMHDQGLLLSGSADKTIRLWTRQTRTCGGKMIAPHECVGVLTGHTAPVRSLRVSVVEELRGVCAGVAFSGSLDGSIKMWMIATSAVQVQAEADHDQESRALSM